MSGIPEPAEFTNPPLPSWVQEFRPDQWEAAVEVVERFEAGDDVVMLDAPTGTGKTLIGELVRRMVGRKAAYVCSSLTLQDQFLRDFPYARVLKGRRNYPTLDKPWPMVSAADCTKTGPGDRCRWCERVNDCPYNVARRRALMSPLAVVNTAYFLAECNGPGKMSGRDLVIVDEADTLEGSLMGYVEFSVGDRTLDGLGIDAPKKGVHRPTIARWLEDELRPAVKARLGQLAGDEVRVIRERESLTRLGEAARIVAGQVGEDWWVRDNDAGPLVLKPVRVDSQGRGKLWEHGDKWLLMSATIVSPDEMAESLGLSTGLDSGMDEQTVSIAWSSVSVPMRFPIDHRPIIVAPVANMAKKNQADAWPKMVKAIARVMGEHPNDRILVHTVSYALSRYLARELPRGRVITYENAKDRESVLSRFRGMPAGVLLASSMDRGVDLAGDSCRVVVVAKVPFPNLGDRQTSERLHGPGGSAWYAVQTVRSLVQMTGRATRSMDDWSTCYILDQQFVSNVWKRNKGLLPGWWREAVDMSYPVARLVA